MISPPKSVKDSGSGLHSKLKEAFTQSGLEENLFGIHPVPLQGAESRSPPPAPGATTRKSAMQVERQNSEIYYAEDEDTNRKKYSRRGTFRHKFLRSLLPFWSSSLPTLPVTAPPQKNTLHADDTSEDRVRHRRSSRTDPRKLLLVIAIMACMATLGILYYRISQRALGEELLDVEPQ
ncbi:hypothetical protein BUALT_Bualt19G0103300 [Buddleja alternifolia]|uniref:Uncharacterized protein n=1 Tax=Buddleja alternifolia TaxID=168488 RepID=A0AAV6W6N6_9LAMI|nr:hypothetical protein BUALT_Bualt19G0103300 [Buddleja alternifolia]